MKKYEHYTTSIIKMEQGIEDISYSYITSKVLVKYNPQLTNEKKIVDWIKLCMEKNCRK